MTDHHLTCRTFQTINPDVKFLVDSGSDLNLIKISTLRDEVIVYEEIIYHLKGISEQLVKTMGYTTIGIQVGNRTIPTEFQVIHPAFPIPHDGILGKPFITGNQTIINYQTNELTLPTDDEIISALDTHTIIPARTEILVAIPAPDFHEGETLLVSAQTIGEVLMCSNTVNNVQDGCVLVSVMNPREEAFELTTSHVNKFNIEKFNTAMVHTLISKTETSYESSRITKLRSVLRTEQLNSEEQESLVAICDQYTDIFHLEGDKLTNTEAVYHEINIPTATQPINERPYRLPFKHKQEINKQVKQWEEDGIITPSKSPWNAPLLVVPKKPDRDGVVQYRICVDFRKLNHISSGDAYPLPNITDILDQLGKSRYYTTLDLAQGYHQVKMHPDHKERTAFSTERGHFEFQRVPFGLKGAPATFQRLMNTVLTGLNGLKTFVYLDDIIIYARDIPDHSKKLQEVFERLRQFNLKLQPTKCEFMRKEVNYLGHVITDQGVRPDPQKVQCVMDYPIPRNSKDIKSFLGLSGYYRRFIPDYGKIAKPLTSLLKKDVEFKWSDLCQKAFEDLKNALTNEPLLQYPDFNQIFNLTCDASGYAIGCVLSQGPIGKDLPIAYASRTLNKAEQNYSTTERELCAIIWGVKQFRPYLLGQEFNIITDHRALTWLFNVKDPGSRLTRWRLKLEEYQYQIQYKPGCNNTNADALSRIRVTTRAQTLRNEQIPESSESTESTENPEPTNTTESTEIPKSTNTTEFSKTSKFSDTLESSNKTESYQIFLNSDDSPTSNVTEIAGDIFSTSSDTSLAHCVSADLKMSRGIALQFRRRFGQIQQLRQQEKSLEDVILLRVEDRTIFYLITKLHSWQKPTYQSIFNCLRRLKLLCEEKQITKLACPRIGCELDGLKWEEIRKMLRYIFKNSTIYVSVYTKEELSEDEKLRLISEFHDTPLGGHQGVTRTFNRIYAQCHWKGMRKQIRDFIKKCPICQKNKIGNKPLKEPMMITTTASRPFEKIFLDVVGPLPRSHKGNSFILTLIDDLTKFAWAAPMENHEANTVAHHFVTQFVCLHGLPQSLVTDCGTEFLSKVFKEVCNLLKIKQTSTTPYHPQSNGSLERSHRTLGEYLRNFIDKDPLNWDVKIPYAMFCHNSTVHSATKYQPYELVYGNPVAIPSSLLKEPEPRYNYEDYQFEIKKQLQESHAIAKKHLIEAKHKSKAQYDKNANNRIFEVGQKVLLQDKTSINKLTPKWLGPFEVLEVDPINKNVTIKKKAKRQKIHPNLLKPFYE